MPRCHICGTDTELYAHLKPTCLSCDGEQSLRRARIASDLTEARLQVQRAQEEVNRLKDIYVAAPKASSDGDLAIRLALRTYESAHLNLVRAWRAHIDTLED
jgi:hypothetical protein